MFKVALTNLGQYNEGVLNYIWIDLPISDEDFKNALEKIDIGKEDEFGVPYEEYFLTDWDTDIPGIGKCISEYSSIKNLNEIAEKMQRLNDEEKIAMEAYLKGYLDDFDYAYEHVKKGAYVIHNDCEDTTDLAHKFVDEYGCLGNLSDEAKRYFNYHAYGRDLGMENFLYFVKRGDRKYCVEILA